MQFSPTLLLTAIHLLFFANFGQTQLVFLGQQPFAAYMSLATLPRQTVYQFFAVDSATGEANGIEYTITRNVEPPGGEVLFIVDANTGALFLNNAGGLSLTQYTLNVEARRSRSANFIIASITVTVVRESDTAPRFEHPSYQLTVSESLQIGRPFSVIRGFSLYSNNTTPQRYSIVGGNNDAQFTIGNSNGVLRISQSLDREMTSMYMLTVRYVDELTTIDASVNVVVTDENDNSPSFDSSLYNISVAETLPPQGFVAQVFAVDPDDGENGTIFYGLDSSVQDTFSLNSSTGRITTLTRLDFERQAQYQFTVTASDMGTPPQVSVVTVLLRLINFDDECPRFENPIFIAELPYDPDAGMVPSVNMVIISVMATDPDRLSNVTYSVISSTDLGNILSLDSTTGDITLTRVDPELRGQYTLNVSASDATCVGQSFARVEVNIGNINDHSPVFGSCEANLIENPPNGTEVIRLVATDEDIGFNGLVTYSLLTNTDLFGIDASSGVVRTIAPPERYDRETQSFLSVGAIASDGGNRQDYCQLLINLIDENDNAPALTLPSYNTTLSSSALPGTFIVQVQATDGDSGANGEVSYSLSSSGNSHTFFTVDSSTGMITTRLALPGVGVQAEYIFNVTATDRAPGNSSLSSSAVVNVTVVEGTSFPIFDESNYTVTICENTPFLTPVLTVSASSTLGEIILYEIVAGNSYRSNQDEAFRILEATIEVGSNTVIDFERLTPSSSFLFFVRATNSAGSSLTSVEIFVDDIDDSRPQFLRTDLSITIPEQYPVGATVDVLEAVDADSGTNGEIAFRVSNVTVNPGRQFFEVASNGTITVTHEFDFENPDELHGGEGAVLIVEAYNPNPPEVSICVTIPRERVQVRHLVRWSITDFNDNPPRFVVDSYSKRIPEDMQTQTQILSLNASDPDVSDANRLRYSIISGNSDGNFGIQSNQLILAQRLDYEAVSTYTLRITVTDGIHIGNSCPSCVATVTILVEDVDDEPPRFSQSEYRGEVVENADINTMVLQLNAADPDSASISYELRGLAEGRFTVDNTGRISVSGPIDREEFTGGEVVFLAFAEGGALATANIVIHITDINDYIPRFANEFSGRVQENTSPGEDGLYVTDIRAVDLDNMENGTVTYSLLSGEESGFRIDNITGRITAHAKFDREAKPTFNLVVQATDSGSALQLSSTTQVLITIGDNNDNKPFFPFPYMYARIFENAPVGQHVITIPAVDLDNSTNATITYTLVSSSSNEVKFSLDRSSGVISVAGSLDYEIPLHRTFNLTISLSDPTYQSETDGTLTIDVLDLNDNAPTIVGPEYLIQRSNNIAETFPAGNVLARVHASDPDSGTNSELKFIISEGDVNGDFDISVDNGVLGNIRNKKQFDRETIPSYNLVVMVTDKGNPPQSSLVTVTFNINDVNDESPKFDQTKYTVSILENTDPNPFLLQVQATDPDTGVGGEISLYTIADGNEQGQFNIEPITGNLSSLVSFDREDMAFYSLMIIAVDGGVSPNTGTTTVEISILDVNDSPTLRGGELVILIYALDGQVRPQPVGPINFNDADIDDTFTDCIFTFQNVINNIYFTVIRDSCVLVLSQPNPLPSLYRYEVLGTDGAHPSTYANLSITVESISRSQVPIESTATLTLNATVGDYFKDQLNITFHSLLAQALEIPSSLLRIFSIQPGYFDPANTVDLFFTAQDSTIGGGFLSKALITSRLALQLDNLSILGHSVISLPVDPCRLEPCFNQAACTTVLTLNETQITAASREHILLSPRVEVSYTCDCVPGTSGGHCEINFDDCYSNPCLFGAQCEDEVNGFKCKCPEGTSGDDCSFNPDECTMNPCLNGATCVNGFGRYVCECLPGYYGNECQYHSFRLSTVCASAPCQNGGTCSAGRDGFTCLCPMGFTGKFCEETSIAQGGCIGNPCYNGSICMDTPQGAVCTCSVGFTGPKCRWPLNNCELDPCENGGTCDPGLYGSYQCICASGYTGVNCSSLIPPCTALPCQNGGRCSNNEDNTYSCECPRLFTGVNCETAILSEDLCDVTPSLCAENATCTSGRDNVTCSCDSQHTGLDCSIKVDTTSPNDLSPCYSNPCLHGGMCSQSTNGLTYMCTCVGGFTGQSCDINIDDCASVSCQHGALCVDGIEGYVCDCPSQTTGGNCQIMCPLGRGGDFCEVDVPLCTDDLCANGTCQEQASGAPTCLCSPGFTGERCEVLNNCDIINCLNGGTCVVAEGPMGEPLCRCLPGFSSPNCEQVSVSFGGSAIVPSYRAFSSLDIRGEGGISFEFVTVERDGMLLYNTQYQDGGSDDFISVEVAEGYLKVGVSHGGRGVVTTRVMSSSVRVSDGNWHQVAIETYGKSVHVSLDTCRVLGEELLTFADCNVLAQTTQVQSFLDLGLPLWLGGIPAEFPLPPLHQISNRGVTGCIRNVYINDHLLDLNSHLSESNSQGGCGQIDDVCAAIGGLCGGGECLPRWEGYRCVCPSQMEGENCDRAAQTLMFGGSTFAQYTLLPVGVELANQRRRRRQGNPSSLRSSLTEELSLRFRTENENGILFHLTGSGSTGDLASIQLEGGYLVYRINLGMGEESVTMTTYPVNDAVWHTFTVKRTALSLSLSLDNTSNVTHNLSSTNLTLDIDPSQIYTGGFPSSNSPSDDIIISNPYVGCLGDIRIDGNILPTVSSNAFASVTFLGDAPISYNCALRACSPSPCGEDGANCTEIGSTGYRCMCSEGHMTVSQPCPAPVPPPTFRLVIVAAPIVGGVVLCVIVTLIGMLCYKTAKKKQLKYLVRQASVASADSRMEQEMFSRHGLVISNEPGGGEQDTSMTRTRWEQRYAPTPHRTPNRNQERHVKFDLSKTSYNSSNDSLAGPENVPLVITNPGRTTASSPTIQAEIEDRVRSANEGYRNLDAIREYEEEGECSEASSLSDICASLEEGEEYTVEHLMKAGPQFSQFVGLLESIIEEEEEMNDSGESEIAHTGMTQATPLTGMTQATPFTTTQQATRGEFPYY